MRTVKPMYLVIALVVILASNSVWARSGGHVGGHSHGHSHLSIGLGYYGPGFYGGYGFGGYGFGYPYYLPADVHVSADGDCAYNTAGLYPAATGSASATGAAAN